MITSNANPALEKAIEATKVEVVADPAGCGDLFNRSAPASLRRHATPPVRIWRSSRSSTRPPMAPLARG